MSQYPFQSDPDVISKSEFARRRNVKPPRVTQWIEAGKIFGPAIVGEGRSAQIRETVACQQLNRTLDMSQRLGNGLATRLKPTSAPPSVPHPTMDFGGITVTDPQLLTTQDQIALQRLEQARRLNDRDRREDAVAAGLLVDAKAARTSAVRQAVNLLTAFEGSLGNFATAISSEFKLPQRDVLHLLRTQFRNVRSQMAGDLRKHAATMPERVDLDLDADSPSLPPDADGDDRGRDK